MEKKKGVYIMNTGFKPNTQQWISFSVLNRIRARRHWMAICKQSTYLKKKCIRWTYFPSKYFPSCDPAFACGSGRGQGHWWFQFPEAELSPWKCYSKHSMNLTVKFYFFKLGFNIFLFFGSTSGPKVNFQCKNNFII